jgi:toxin CcdB
MKPVSWLRVDAFPYAHTRWSSAIGKVSHNPLNPVFKIRGTSVVLHPLEIVSIAINQLGPPVGSLSEQSDLIVAGLDELFTRAWK